MFHYMFTISYDGSSFNGWQLQPDNPLITIQGLLNYELSKFTGEDINIRASGRTDSGVHATCQTADFFCNKNLDLKNFPKELNRNLCDSVRITGICRVRDDFHSRKSALSKTYSYFVSLSDKPDVFFHRFVYTPCMQPLNIKPNMCSSPDIEFMKKCSHIFIGNHDFSAFTTDKSPDKSHVRTISDINISIIENTDIMRIDFTGDGFLYNMVRIIAGTLLQAGYGQFTYDDIKHAMESRIRCNAGVTLPPNALFLTDVEYDNKFFI